MTDRFPGYDVLAKRDTPSWNARTRDVIDVRLNLTAREGVLTDRQVATLHALADRIVPQPESRPPINTVALVVEKIATEASDGFRPEGLPAVAEAWRRGLDALDAQAEAQHGQPFASLSPGDMDALLATVAKGDIDLPAWTGIDPLLFWKWRLLPDLVAAYWAHPSAWSAMGFGGPASPRGYVRLDANRRDPWEAAEREDGALLPAKWRNRLAR